MPHLVFLVLIRNARIQELVYTHLPRFPRFYRILMLPKWFEHSKYFFLWFMFVTKSIFEFRVYFFSLCIEIAQPTHYNTNIPLFTIFFVASEPENSKFFCLFFMVLHPDRTKAPPLRNLSIARELTLASLRICREVQDRCERPQKHRKLE